MSSKRALVVDDSKSARAFLSRILERHEITVDAAESAEAAIDYLTRNRPDVIFMDHMMPGMDGFQAVQSIKNNPRTAAIPILMYTSQEGDLYLGQARALGAEGVLPKQIKQADVTKMLFQLQLVSDRRTRERSMFTSPEHAPDLVSANESEIVAQPVVPAPANPDGASTSADQQFALLLPKMTLEIRAALDQSLQKEIAALRGFIGTTLDSHAERLQGDLATLLPATRTPELDLPTVMPERRSWGAIFGWVLAFIGVAGAAVMASLWWSQGSEIAALRTDLTAAYTELEALRARPEVVSPPPVAEPVAASDDPNAVLPAADAPDAAAATTTAVELVPTGAAAAPATVLPLASGTAVPATPVAAAPAPVAPATAPAAQPQASQAQ